MPAKDVGPSIVPKTIIRAEAHVFQEGEFYINEYGKPTLLRLKVPQKTDQQLIGIINESGEEIPVPGILAAMLQSFTFEGPLKKVYINIRVTHQHVNSHEFAIPEKYIPNVLEFVETLQMMFGEYVLDISASISGVIE
ncbi:MAG: hypothetical protein P1Q69_07050 [Candidatus Thorarchaeota archaeon]|nr:hypothetical protein [Candidatus Thorarchaeota archaeon]